MNIRLELRHLTTIRAIAETGNGTHAARLLNISQSALSHRLHEAERRLGTKLYRQIGKGLQLTAEGERLNRSAVLCMEELHMAEREIELRKNHAEHVVRVGATIYGGFHWLPPLIKKLRAADTGIELEIVSDVSPNLLDMLQQNKIDLAIVTAPVRNRKLKAVLLYREELLAVLPTNHPKAKAPYFMGADFSNEVFVTETAQREWMGASKTFFEWLGASPKRIMRVGHTEAALTLVASGIGITAETRERLAVYRRTSGIITLPITSSGTFAEHHLIAPRKQTEKSPEHIVTQVLIDVIDGTASRP